jgi:ABC-2 type transport system permease protein
MKRLLAIVRAQLRASAAMALQYRLDFVVEGLLALLWMAVTLVPVLVVFGKREQVAGWTFPEMLLVLGWFVALKGFLEGAISPSLTNVIEHVRKGTLDVGLLKPVDAQLLGSLAKIEPWRAIDVFGALAIFTYAFRKIGHHPTLPHVLLALGLLFAALLVLYSIAIIVVSIAFFAVRVDNLLYLFQSVFDVARWPTSIFRGGLAIFFTYVMPLAVMTTSPALAL